MTTIRDAGPGPAAPIQPQLRPGGGLLTEDRPRPLSKTTVDDTVSLLGSLFGALGLVWVIYEELLPFSGVLGFLICWYLTFLALYAAVTALSHPRPVVVDRVMRAVITGAGLVIAFALGTVILYTFVQGWPALHHLNFFTKDMTGVSPNEPLNRGGVLHAIVGTAIELAIATSVALPFGIAAAIYMTEVGGRFSRVVRTVVEAMTALPDLIAGLFIYVALIVALGLPKSGLAAGLALMITMTPIIARSAEVALRVVPGGLREAGLALGAPKRRVVRSVVLPSAGSGLATALILAVARAVGETAPLLIVSGASSFLTFNPVSNPMNSLPLYIFTMWATGEPNGITRAFGAASLLLVIVFVIFALIRLLASRGKGTSR